MANVESLSESKTHCKMMQPLFDEFVNFKTRLATFDNWPCGLAQKPESLATAGFFYTGRGDAVVCFYCGVRFIHWSSDDDPWIEHTRWRGEMCAFVLLHKGAEFVVQHLDPRRRPAFDWIREGELTITPNIHDAECDCVNNDVEECKSLTCRVCMRDMASVMFAPCGHIVCCVNCADDVVKCKQQCPSCDVHITDRIKVHIG
jgi:baculoviral IAP repeat-containing protein 7/8